MLYKMSEKIETFKCILIIFSVYVKNSIYLI